MDWSQDLRGPCDFVQLEKDRSSISETVIKFPHLCYFLTCALDIKDTFFFFFFGGDWVFRGLSGISPQEDHTLMNEAIFLAPFFVKGTNLILQVSPELSLARLEVVTGVLFSSAIPATPQATFVFTKSPVSLTLSVAIRLAVLSLWFSFVLNSTCKSLLILFPN